MPRPCCKSNTQFVRESHLVGCLHGQCIVCGTIRHGHKSNWRLTPVGGKVMMVYRDGEKLKTYSRKEDKKPPAPKRLTAADLMGLDLEKGIEKLRQLGIIR